MPECHLPLFDLIDDLRVTGARTAELYYGAKGFVVHHNTDLWRAAAPVDIHAGIWPMGGVWLVQHLWDHFEYNPDLDFLRVRAYPAMKEAARFVMDFLVEAPEGVKFAGLLITNPSYSPENAYRDGRDRRRHLTISSTMDVQLIRDLVERCLIASELLGENSAFEHEIRKVLDRIPPCKSDDSANCRNGRRIGIDRKIRTATFLTFTAYIPAIRYPRIRPKRSRGRAKASSFAIGARTESWLGRLLGG